MPKLLIFFVILGFIGLCVFALYKLFTDRPGKKWAIQQEDTEIDTLIETLKTKIAEEEIRSQAGIENAKAKMAEYQEKLKKAEEYKLKTKNL